MGVTWCRLEGFLHGGSPNVDGLVMMVVSMSGGCCYYGFSNSDDFDEKRAAAVPGAASRCRSSRPGILAELFNNADA